MEPAVRALVKDRPAPGLTMSDVAMPRLERDDVLVRVLRTGICGTDLHIYAWDSWAEQNVPVPLVIGHEFVGEIVELGADVADLELHEIVSGEGHLVCGRCRNCRAGRRVQCARTASVGVNRPGAFAEYIALPARNIWRHSRGVDLDVAAIFDPLGNAVHSALSFPVLGEDVLITGAGPIGIMAGLVAKHAGARYVVVTDPSAYRRRLVDAVGLTRSVDPNTTKLTEVMERLEMKEGFDVGFEMSGKPAALRSMLPVMCHGAKIAMLGLPSEEFGIDWGHLVTNMVTLKGIYGRQIFETWYSMSVLVEAGLDVSPVITHRFPAEEYEAAFAVLRAGECGKVVLSWEETADA
jgi:threonine 3-dehydrogenase